MWAGKTEIWSGKIQESIWMLSCRFVGILFMCIWQSLQFRIPPVSMKKVIYIVGGYSLQGKYVYFRYIIIVLGW